MIQKSKEFRKFKLALKKSRTILISTHLLPDGDGLGAQAALFHYLKKSGKKCQVLNPDPLPSRYRFLGDIEARTQRKKKQWDLWIILDTNDPRRLGPQWATISTTVDQIVFLDHHPPIKGQTASAAELPPNAMVVSDTSSSSIGELLHTLFSQLKWVKLDSKIALGLYVSVMTDTNSFRYARTTPQAHQIAAEMIGLGVNPEEIYQLIYSSKKVSHLQLLGTLLQRVQISQGGQIAWIEMDRELRLQYQASADETLSFLNLLLLIQDAEVICFFREEDYGQTRVSIKSKGRFVINQIAMDLGGGGHDYAAGLALTLPLNQTRARVISRLESLLNSAKKVKRPR